MSMDLNMDSGWISGEAKVEEDPYGRTLLRYQSMDDVIENMEVTNLDAAMAIVEEGRRRAWMAGTPGWNGGSKKRLCPARCTRMPGRRLRI